MEAPLRITLIKFDQKNKKPGTWPGFYLRFSTTQFPTERDGELTKEAQASDIAKRPFSKQSAQSEVAGALRRQGEAESHRTYHVLGQVFFSSADKFTDVFDFKEALNKVTIDLTQAHFWDITAVSALDKVVIKFRRQGAEVELLGLNEASTTLDRFGAHDKLGAIDKLMNH